MGRLIGGQFIGTAPQGAVGKRRVEALYQGDNAAVSNFKNMDVLLVVARFCAGKATILRHCYDHLARYQQSLSWAAQNVMSSDCTLPKTWGVTSSKKRCLPR